MVPFKTCSIACSNFEINTDTSLYLLTMSRTRNFPDGLPTIGSNTTRGNMLDKVGFVWKSDPYDAKTRDWDETFEEMVMTSCMPTGKHLDSSGKAEIPESTINGLQIATNSASSSPKGGTAICPLRFPTRSLLDGYRNNVSRRQTWST